MNTEDKQAWCKVGADKELPFVASLFVEHGLGAMMNPCKVDDPFSHDALVTLPMDVKSISTPLFRAREMFGFDPQFTITFNEKDLLRYEAKYPQLLVMFHVNWQEFEKDMAGVTYRVEPMNRIWYAPVQMIRRLVDRGMAKVIDYQRRVNDTRGNAKRSYVFDVRWFYLIGGRH